MKREYWHSDFLKAISKATHFIRQHKKTSYLLAQVSENGQSIEIMDVSDPDLHFLWQGLEAHSLVMIDVREWSDFVKALKTEDEFPTRFTVDQDGWLEHCVRFVDSNDFRRCGKVLVKRDQLAFAFAALHKSSKSRSMNKNLEALHIGRPDGKPDGPLWLSGSDGAVIHHTAIEYGCVHHLGEKGWLIDRDLAEMALKVSSKKDTINISFFQRHIDENRGLVRIEVEGKKSTYSLRKPQHLDHAYPNLDGVCHRVSMDVPAS